MGTRASRAAVRGGSFPVAVEVEGVDVAIAAVAGVARVHFARSSSPMFYVKRAAWSLLENWAA